MKKSTLLVIIPFMFLVVISVIFYNNQQEIYFEKCSITTDYLIDSPDIIQDIVNQMMTMGYEGDIASEIKVYALEQPKKLEQKKITLYRVQLDYALADMLVIYKAGVFEQVIPHMTFQELYITDMNFDGGIELLMQGSFGSGMYYIQLSHFDIKTGQLLTNYFYNNNDPIVLIPEKNKIMAYTHYRSFNRRAQSPIGAVFIKDEIIIENLSSKITKVFCVTEEKMTKRSLF